MLKLRPYQNEIKSQVYLAWTSNYRNVLLVMPTGSGKTKTFCSIVIDTMSSFPTAIMVHRKELVQQICLTLAEEGIAHNIIASRKDISGIIKAERRALGRQFYNVHAPVTVISVDTLISRENVYQDWCKNILQVVIDEAGHVTKDNKWGKAREMFVNARCLGVTATPERLDKKGLGSHADGIFDVMIQGPTTRWLIDNGYLSKYKIIAPASDYTKYLKSSSDTSDYSKQSMIEASNKSQIVGDVVDTYLKYVPGKQAILFASDVATAERMEAKFKERKVVAKSLDGTTPDGDRLESLILFREKKIQVLINVDLFDEGLDVPGIEIVIMARPTKSLSKFLQMVGRGLRISPDKEYSILIDHVGNIKGPNDSGHGLPCKIRQWSLDRVVRRGNKVNFMKICSNVSCNSPYDRVNTECPWCGWDNRPAPRADGGGGRSTLQEVDGDLVLLDPETIRKLESKMYLEDPAVVAQRASFVGGPGAGQRALKNQQERIEMQKTLSEGIAVWAGKMRKYYGMSDRSIHKKFYLEFNQTITEALGEPKAEMEYTLQKLEDIW